MAGEFGRKGLSHSTAEDAQPQCSLWSEISPFRRGGEQFGLLRFCMVTVSFAPLFLLIAIRGNDVVGDVWMWSACLLLIFLPGFLVVRRIVFVWRKGTTEVIAIGQAEDGRSHVLGYLFATMLPFYRSSIEEWRDLLALAVALGFILFLFWCLRWHYVNWVLLLAGYRVYTVTPIEDPARLGRRTPLVLVTRRRRPLSEESVRARRVSDTVYWETGI